MLLGDDRGPLLIQHWQPKIHPWIVALRSLPDAAAMSTTSPTDLQPHLSSVSRSPAISLSSQVMVAAIIFFSAVVVFVVLLHVYARKRWGRMAASATRRTRLVFADDQDPPAAPHRGLDRSAIEALPVSVYWAEAGGGGLECAVCLSELSDGEKVRILPKCSHGFHLDCIDMWFHSHSTCPLCRRPVGPSGDLEAGGGAEATPPQEQPDLAADSTVPNLPTNVLFWGTHNQVRTVAQEAGAAAAASSSSSPAGKPDGALVIQIPRQAAEFSFSSPLSPLPSSKFPGDHELKSPAATAVPTPARLRSFRRILSREKRVVGPSCSPRGGVVGDVEQGLGGTDGGGCRGAVPRTPGPNP